VLARSALAVVGGHGQVNIHKLLFALEALGQVQLG
jgi:hypothetical protein